nr:MAG TPA: hypothetical protein [Caudoviricetes sp.]
MTTTLTYDSLASLCFANLITIGFQGTYLT